MALGWDYGSNIVDITYHSLAMNMRNTTESRAYGLDCYNPTDANTRDIQVRNSIDSGVPVLVLGGRGVPEWSIVLGYEIEDGIVKFFGRSYCDEGAADDELYTENRYALTKNYPGEGLIKLFDKSCDPLLPLEALRISLETCLEMFKPHEKFGYDAYNRMIQSFEENKFVTDWNSEGIIYTILINLTDARRAAYIYLNENAELLAGENKKKLLTTSSLYRDMFNTLMELKDEDDFDRGIITASEQTRNKYAAKLRSCLERERQAHGIIREILDNWQIIK